MFPVTSLFIEQGSQVWHGSAESCLLVGAESWLLAIVVDMAGGLGQGPGEEELCP